MELPGVGVVGGQWDLRETIEDYLAAFPFAGKRVLDVGAARGFPSFEMERRGAEVVSFDMSPDGRWDIVPLVGLDLDAVVSTSASLVSRRLARARPRRAGRRSRLPGARLGSRLRADAPRVARSCARRQRRCPTSGARRTHAGRVRSRRRVSPRCPGSRGHRGQKSNLHTRYEHPGHMGGARSGQATLFVARWRPASIRTSTTTRSSSPTTAPPIGRGKSWARSRQGACVTSALRGRSR